MTRAALALLAAVGGLASCGPDSPVPYVYCDEEAVFPEITESVSAGGLAHIDATEVTQGQYQLFLDATAGGTDVSGQPSYCAWNTTYAQDTECLLGGLADERMLEEVLACDSRPVTCVDWCDAYMYCQWAGKHLCGSRRDGTRIPLEQVATLESEWYIACSAGEQNRYGAGDFERTSASCNTLECYSARTCVFPTDLVTMGAPVAPGSMRDCEPPQSLYQGVYDMTGNVSEWENACDGETGPDDQCARRGGFWRTGPLPCDFAPTNARSDTLEIVGFRCCGDPSDR